MNPRFIPTHPHGYVPLKVVAICPYDPDVVLSIKFIGVIECEFVNH